MPNMQGSSAVHLVEEGGKYSSFDKQRQFLMTIRLGKTLTASQKVSLLQTLHRR